MIIHSGSLEMREVPDYPALDLAAVLHKPFGIHELLDVVKRILPLASVEKAGATGNVPPETSPAVPFHFPGRNLTPLPSLIDSTQPHSNTMQPSSSRARHQPWTAPMPTPEPVSAPPKRVLIADDDALVRGSLAAVLESEGFVTAEAKNGAEAVTRAIEHTPDLVLLDLNMPRWDGWTAFSQLDRVTPLLPVIVITARPNQYQKAMQLGVDAFMEKPLDIAALVQAIKRLTSEDEHRHVRRITSPAFVTQLLGCPESR